MTMSDEKMWGEEPFWGLGYEWDPDWVLTERQKELRATLIGLCEQELRDNAKRSDDELLFPRRNLELLGEHGFLALTVPEEYGGLGENHVAYSMVCETIARYGCASTAMCYVMHIGAVNAIMLRATDALIDKYGAPALIKIDVEGFEAEALQGLTHAVKALSFEFTIIQRDVALACIERCIALGYVRFNAALGESQTFVNAEWVGGEAIARWLAGLPQAANSGDIYAALA